MLLHLYYYLFLMSLMVKGEIIILMSSEGNQLKIIVKDDRFKILEEDINKIFEPFFYN